MAVEASARLLRGILDFGDDKITPETKAANYDRLKASKIKWAREDDGRIVRFIEEFFLEHLEIPSAITVIEHFEDRNDIEVVERMKQIGGARVYDRAGYSHFLRNTIEELNNIRASALLKEVQQIITPGKVVREGKTDITLKGVQDAFLYFNQNILDILPSEQNSKTIGDLRDDTGVAWKDYQTAKVNKDKAYGRLTGFNTVDLTCHGCKRGELWIHAGFTGDGKCLPGDTTVFDHRTSRRRRLDELYACKELPVVTALAKEGKDNSLVVCPTSHLMENGLKPVYNLNLLSGRTIGATSNHRFLTTQGWKELSELRSGDFIATPKQMKAEGKETYTSAEVKVVGYLIGDGHINECIQFHQLNEEIRNDFTQCLRKMGLMEGRPDYEKAWFAVKFPENRVPYVEVGHGLGDRWHRVVSPLRVLLERLGLYGSIASTKFIPSEFFGMTEELVAELLGALWSTDGSCNTGDYIRKDRGGSGKQSHYVIEYSSISHQLCLDIQSLLLRLGIQSTVTERSSEYKVWTVRVITNPSKRRFCEKVKVVGKEGKFQYLLSRIPSRDTTPVPSCLLPDGKKIRMGHYWRYARTARNYNGTVSAGEAALFGVSTGYVFWDRVREVVPRGIEMTYDLSVPEHHTFVANDIITHNTTFSLNWAYNQVTHYMGHVLYVSLEETYTQIRNKIFSMHSSNYLFERQGKKALDYRKIRDGDLSSEEEAFYQEVLNDFDGNSEYCRFRVWQPDRDISISDIKVHAELVHKEMELGLIIIDHSGLVEPRKNYRDYTVAINSVIRDAKKLALHFNSGEGIAVCLLHQINRQGRQEAEKNEGIYKLSALSYANEAERSADYVTATFLDEKHREEGTIQMANLKNRDNKPFDPATLNIDFSCRRMHNRDASEMNHMSVDEHDDVLANVGL